MFAGYEWPGNIRELQNVIQRSVILAEDELVVDESWLPKRPTRPPGLGFVTVLCRGASERQKVGLLSHSERARPSRTPLSAPA